MPITLSAQDVRNLFDTTAPPPFRVGDLVVRCDEGSATRGTVYVVENIYNPGTYPGARFSDAYYVRCRSLRGDFPMRGHYLAARFTPASSKPPPPTNHRIGVPKNKLP